MNDWQGLWSCRVQENNDSFNVIAQLARWDYSGCLWLVVSRSCHNPFDDIREDVLHGLLDLVGWDERAAG